MHEIAALYCRLSRDDGEYDDSGSIVNQKEQLTEYAKSHKMKVYKTYVDDGYTGTNFNRPGFQELLKDAELKKFNVLIVKDLSRLGRNYIHTGLYTEEYFPQRNIRVIAINDNFDTSSGDNEFAPFKNIINEWYTKDISKKVRATHSMHQQKGIIPTGKLPLYGYMYDGDRKRILDPDTAPIVERIYNEFVNGLTLTKIAQSLEADKIIVPGYYYYKKYNYYSDKFASYTDDQICHWTKPMIEKILSKKEYTGDLYLAKTYVKSFKIKQDVINPIDKQYHFEDMFPAIITKDTYEQALKIREGNKKIQYETPYDIYRGVVRCYCCGEKLKIRNITYKDKKEIAFGCRNKDCTDRTIIKAEYIENLIKKELNRLSEILQYKDYFLEFCKDYFQKHIDVDVEDHTKEINELTERNKKLDVIIEKLIEQHLEDQIPLATYERMLAKYKAEYEANNKKINSYSGNKPETINYYNLAKSFIKNLEEIKDNYNKAKLMIIFEAIYLYKRKGKKGKIKFGYEQLGTVLEEFINAINQQ